MARAYVREICGKIKGKKVLDIGCCASARKTLMQRHKEYRKASGEIIGIDINEEFIKISNGMGFKNIFKIDITNYEDVVKFIGNHGKFQEIIATDVIEHIGNLTEFLDNVFRLLSNNGRVHITTPNMRSVRWVYQFVNSREKLHWDHVCWFEPTSIEVLLGRSNLKTIKSKYINDNENTKDNNVKKAKSLGLEYKPWMATKIYIIAGKK